MSREENERTKITQTQKRVKKFVKRLKAVPAMSWWKVYTSHTKRQIQLTYKKRGKKKAKLEFEVITAWCKRYKLLPERYVLVLVERTTKASKRK